MEDSKTIGFLFRSWDSRLREIGCRGQKYKFSAVALNKYVHRVYTVIKKIQNVIFLKHILTVFLLFHPTFHQINYNFCCFLEPFSKTGYNSDYIPDQLPKCIIWSLSNNHVFLKFTRSFSNSMHDLLRFKTFIEANTFGKIPMPIWKWLFFI